MNWLRNHQLERLKIRAAGLRARIAVMKSFTVPNKPGVIYFSTGQDIVESEQRLATIVEKIRLLSIGPTNDKVFDNRVRNIVNSMIAEQVQTSGSLLNETIIQRVAAWAARESRAGGRIR